MFISTQEKAERWLRETRNLIYINMKCMHTN